jgi:hypothetical protein
MVETYGWYSRNDGSSDGQGRYEDKDASEHAGELGGWEVAKVDGSWLGLHGNF